MPHLQSLSPASLHFSLQRRLSSASTRQYLRGGVRGQGSIGEVRGSSMGSGAQLGGQGVSLRGQLKE